MATCKPIGIDNFINDMKIRANEFKRIAGASLFEGAGIVADQLRRNIEELPERSPGIARTGKKRGVTKYQKAAMLKALGISKMQRIGGGYDIKIGFSGYDGEATKAYPKGHPISMIARSVESGTSFLEKTPFIRPAYNQAHVKAESAMAEALEVAWAEFSVEE